LLKPFDVQLNYLFQNHLGDAFEGLLYAWKFKTESPMVVPRRISSNLTADDHASCLLLGFLIM